MWGKQIIKSTLQNRADRYGVLAVDSENTSLTYLVDRTDRLHIGIATADYVFHLNRAQVRAMAKEAERALDVLCYDQQRHGALEV